jgi:hypothetical protein
MMPKRGKPQVIDVDLSARQGKLRDFGGSTYDAWNDVIFKQVYEALWVGGAGEQPSPEQTSASAAGLRGIAPRDELEGMLAAQLIACHNASMECFRRAMIGGQTFEGQRESLNQANKLSRTYDRNRRINPMQSKLPMHLSRRCGARTRRGSPCQSPAMLNGRCRMHGGKSPGAPKGNKNAWKHGQYSAEAMARRRDIAELLRTTRELIG